MNSKNTIKALVAATLLVGSLHGVEVTLRSTQDPANPVDVKIDSQFLALADGLTAIVENLKEGDIISLQHVPGNILPNIVPYLTHYIRFLYLERLEDIANLSKEERLASVTPQFIAQVRTDFGQELLNLVSLAKAANYFNIPELIQAAIVLITPRFVEYVPPQPIETIEKYHLFANMFRPLREFGPLLAPEIQKQYLTVFASLSEITISDNEGPIDEWDLLDMFTPIVEFSPDSTKVVTTSDDYTAKDDYPASWDYPAKIVDANTGTVLHTIQHNDHITSAQFSPDGTKVVTTSFDGIARIVDVNTGKLLYTIKHERPVDSAQFSPDGTKVVTASHDNTAKVVDATTGTVLYTIQHEDSVFSAQFSPDGTKVATASAGNQTSGTAKIVDVKTGKLLHTIQHDDWVYSAQFSPDGTKVVTASHDGIAKIVDAVTGAVLHNILHDYVVYSARFSPDGTKVVTASADETVKIVNANTGNPLLTIQHDSYVRSAQFSPDGTKVVTASLDDTAKIVDVKTGTVLHTIQHNHSVYSAQFSPDGTKVATASADFTAKIVSLVSDLTIEQMWYIAKRCQGQLDAAMTPEVQTQIFNSLPLHIKLNLVQQEAATKIQAVVRGRQVRRALQRQKAAIKIQAAARGRQVRKREDVKKIRKRTKQRKAAEKRMRMHPSTLRGHAETHPSTRSRVRERKDEEVYKRKKRLKTAEK